ncbi:GPI transamidase component Gpi16 subunit, partial [Trifolium medium]|nr:GPI transamidase component Gpi16 subunit [Trifolium medium]
MQLLINFFQGLSPDEVLELTTPFSGAEIKEVVVNSDGNKSPGPDGFNFAFFKRFWDILKVDVEIM